MHLEKKQHFIRQIIENDLSSGTVSQVITRFPPEPNGFLHVGHAKSICLNFGMKLDYQGQCNLRYDDTNPEKENEEYIQAIREDVTWLVGDIADRITYASDYYEQLYDYAVELIKVGKAYVDSLSAQEIRDYRGTLQTPGKDSPYRNRSVEENLRLFEQMRGGKFKEGEHILRAKIDMASANINLRDPALYRIRYAHHPRTGDKWCIYPMYDFAHPLSDAIEAITHSLCTLEFQDHRPLYDWFIENTSVAATPKQIEFSRLNLSHTITSKRKLKQLVDEQHVTGWDDPRMPTIRGMRARGYPPKALREFCEAVGISKSDSVIDMSLLENCVRDELNQTAVRAMCVLEPLKVVITNYPEDQLEWLTATCHPQDDTLGDRQLPFGREIWIEQEDFMENPPKKFFRLSIGQEVRLRNAYVIKCEDIIKDDAGNVIELRCSYDPNTLGKKPEGRKVKGVIHWVSATHNHPCQIHLFDRLFNHENPGSLEMLEETLNPNSLHIQKGCFVEQSLQHSQLNEVFQFERQGYFKLARVDKELTFFRVVTLKDTWQKLTEQTA